MTEKVHIPYQLDAAASFEMMLAAGARAYTGRWRLAVWIYQLLLGLFVPFGAVALIMLAAISVTGSAPQTLWTYPIVVVIAGFGAITLARQLQLRIAHMAARSRFGREGAMQADARGVTISTQHSTWQTGWSDVDAVLQGKRAIGFAVSGIVLPIPLSAFGSVDHMVETAGRLKRWHEAAHE